MDDHRRNSPPPGFSSLLRTSSPTHRPLLAPHVAKALGSPGASLPPTGANRQRSAVQRAAAPGGLHFLATRGPAGRGKVVQCNGTVNEEEGNPGFWYTGEKRSIRDFLRVDCHMVGLNTPEVQPESFNGFQGSALELFTSKGSLMRVQYRFGSWNVFIYWPTVWVLGGQDYYPAPNRFGFVPSAEFGNPTFMGETSVRTDLVKVTPFPYKTLGGATFTPEVDFLFGEAISSSVYRQLASKAKISGVKAAVKEVLNR